MWQIPQSVAFRVVLKAFLATDHITAATGKTIAIKLSKNAGAFGDPSGGATNATEIANGWYYVDLSTTDTGTIGPLIVRGTNADTDASELMLLVCNAHNGGFDGVPNAAAEAAGGLYTRGNGAGQINQPANGLVDTNTVKFGGTTVTGRDIGASVLLSNGTSTGQVSLSSGAVTVGTNNDKTGYTLSQTFPSNFADLAIDASGRVNVGKINDADVTGTGISTDLWRGA